MTVAPIPAPPPSDLLREIYSTRQVRDAEGNALPLDAEIHEHNACALYRMCRRQRPRLVIEVGMAYGIASLSILTALEENGDGGQLISIDPNQRTQWSGVGLANVHRAGLDHAHRLIEAPSHLALPQLLSQGHKVDLGYIDGWHTFDYTLIDLFYLDKMIPAAGVVALNDCHWPAVRRVISFLRTHRHYRELGTGLPPLYHARTPLRRLARRLLRLPLHDRYFEKTEDWEPNWDFYVHF